MIKVAAVSYFNARPLVECLRDDPALEVQDLPPAAAAKSLLLGEADVGLVPCVTLLRDEELTYLPGLCIGARGAVESVLLYLKPDALSRSGPLRIALDPHSRTSQKLTRIFLEEFEGVSGERIHWQEASPRDLFQSPEEAAVFDGILVIGDLALNARPAGDWRCVDLPEVWLKETGLPFVFAIWGVRRSLLSSRADLAGKFEEALARGMARLDTIVSRMAPEFGLPDDVARRYLTERIVFRMDEDAERGLKEFLRRCREMGD